MALSFTHGELENIRMSFPISSPQVLLGEVLTQWSQWPTDTHPDHPTMEKLRDALRSGPVGLGVLANQIYSSPGDYMEPRGWNYMRRYNYILLVISFPIIISLLIMKNMKRFM